MPAFTIGIPTYNRAKFIRRTIEAALGQSAPDVEVVISDDASTDATPEIVRSFGDRVRYHRHPQNIGLERNFRAVVEMARGEYFAWLQDDDLHNADFARRALQAFAMSNDVVFYAAFEMVTPSPRSVYYGTVIGPCLPADWSTGRVELIPGYLVPPLGLLTSIAYAPAMAFKTSLLRRACDQAPPHNVLNPEGFMPAAVAAEGVVAVDPWVGAIHSKHDGQYHIGLVNDRVALKDQWLESAVAIAKIVDQLPPRWREEFRAFAPNLSEHARWNYLRIGSKLYGDWDQAPPAARDVRDLLLESLSAEARQKLEQECGTSAAGPLKAMVRALTPPVIWSGLTSIRKKMAPAAH